MDNQQPQYPQYPQFPQNQLNQQNNPQMNYGQGYPPQLPPQGSNRKKTLMVVGVLLVMLVVFGAIGGVVLTSKSETPVNTQTPTETKNDEELADLYTGIKIPEGKVMVVNKKLYMAVGGKSRAVFTLDEFDRVLRYADVDGVFTAFVLKQHYKNDNSGEKEKPDEVYAVTKDKATSVFTLPEDTTGYNTLVSPDGASILYETADADGLAESQMKELKLYTIADKQSATVYENTMGSDFSPRFVEWVGSNVYFTDGCRECDGSNRLELYRLNLETKKLNTLITPASLSSDVVAGRAPSYFVNPLNKHATVIMNDDSFYGIGETNPTQKARPAIVYDLNFDDDSLRLIKVTEYSHQLLNGIGYSSDGTKMFYYGSDWEQVDSPEQATYQAAEKGGEVMYYRQTEPTVYSLDLAKYEAQQITQKGDLQQFAGSVLLSTTNNKLYALLSELAPYDGNGVTGLAQASLYYEATIASDGVTNIQKVATIPLKVGDNSYTFVEFIDLPTILKGVQ